MEELISLTVPSSHIPWAYDLLFAGERAAHCPYIYHIISKILMYRKVYSIVEIGTQRGALTAYLGLWGARLDVPVLSLDIEYQLSMGLHPVFERLGVEFCDMDCFSPEGERAIFEVIDNKPTYVICDGGDKKREFQHYAPKVPSGSMLSIHDWGTEVKGVECPCAFQPFEPDEWVKHDVRFATVEKLGESSEQA